MNSKNRVQTLQILIGGHSQLKNSQKLTAITGELARISASSKVPKHSGWLLAVLHTTRALDTTLRELLSAKGWLDQSDHSLGDYMKRLRIENILNKNEKDGWMASVVHKRNRYMHAAGEMPNQLEADAVLSEMHFCLVAVLGRS